MLVTRLGEIEELFALVRPPNIDVTLLGLNEVKGDIEDNRQVLGTVSVIVLIVFKFIEVGDFVSRIALPAAIQPPAVEGEGLFEVNRLDPIKMVVWWKYRAVI